MTACFLLVHEWMGERAKSATLLEKWALEWLRPYLQAFTPTLYCTYVLRANEKGMMNLCENHEICTC